MLIALPSIKEQEAISDILDSSLSRIDVGIEELKKQIEIMKEYRTRLISDVVTGQMDVRGIEVPDYIPEEDAEISYETEEAGDMESGANGDE